MPYCVLQNTYSHFSRNDCACLLIISFSFLDRVSIAVIKHYNLKQIGEERVYFAFIFTVSHQRKSGLELKAETWK